MADNDIATGLTMELVIMAPLVLNTPTMKIFSLLLKKMPIRVAYLIATSR